MDITWKSRFKKQVVSNEYQGMFKEKILHSEKNQELLSAFKRLYY